MKTFRYTLFACAALFIGVAGCFDPFSYGTRAGGRALGDEVSYEGNIYPALLSSCAICHETGGAASDSALVLSSDPAADYASVAALVDTTNVDDSNLLLKASGKVSHEGGGIWGEGTADYTALRAWIEQGAPNN